MFKFVNLSYILLGYSDKTICKLFYRQNMKLYLTIVILTNFIEELIFRYTFWKFEEMYKYDFTIISSFLFSIYHINNFQNSSLFEALLKYLFQFVIACYLYGLIFVTLLHIVINLLAMAFSFYRYQIIK